jgi:proline dehydrogenase
MTPLRNLLLFLSRRKTLRRWMETAGVVRSLTSRFVAGRTLDDAMAVCRQLDEERILATLDWLGENVTSAEEARASSDAYLSAIEEIGAAKLGATVSIKPTRFGMDLSEEICRANVERLVRRAAELETRVEIDMESHGYVERTLHLVRAMHAGYGAVRAVIQAYLYRSERDVAELCDERIPVRLCKGAYLEPRAVAYPRKRDVDASYAHLARMLLDHGAAPALATHDERMLEMVLGLAPDRDRVEFQMLYGIRRDLQRRLVREGYRVRLYVPYGDAWYPYFMRRLAERPANVVFLIRHALPR